MNEVLGFVQSAILQAFVFTLVGFLAFRASKLINRGDSAQASSFCSWIGLSRISLSSLYRLMPIIILFPLVIVLLDFTLQKYSSAHIEFKTSPSSPFAKLWALGWGVDGLVSAFFYSFIQTGFSEEVLFRGFIGRKLISLWGWRAGNLAQALLFSSLHLLLLSFAKVPFAAEVYFIGVVVPFFFGLFAGWLNKRSGYDSIFPSIVAHGLSNFFAYLGYFLYLPLLS